MPFSQLVALMKANTGRVRLFVAVICRPFAMDECFSSSDGAKLRVDGRDSFPSPSLRVIPRQHVALLAVWTGFFPVPFVEGTWCLSLRIISPNGRDSFPSPSLRGGKRRERMARRAMDGILSRPLR